MGSFNALFVVNTFPYSGDRSQDRCFGLDDTAKQVQVAVEWVDLDEFKNALLARLLGGRASV